MKNFVLRQQIPLQHLGKWRRRWTSPHHDIVVGILRLRTSNFIRPGIIRVV